MILRRLPIFLLPLALLSPSGMAQTGRAVFSITGYVRDQTSQQPMENIPVVLKQMTEMPINTVYTRGNGEFEFDGLSNGAYSIEINVKDYEPVRESVSISGASRMGISIILSRSVKAASPIMGMTISAHQLSVPQRARDEFEKGVTLVVLKSDYRGGIVEFQRAIKDFPTYYEAYAEVGEAYYRLGELGPAEEALRKSVDLSSGKYLDALFTLAALLTDTKRYAEAETLARQGIKADASSWRGPFELARAQNALKRPEEAEKSAIESRNLMPDNPEVYLLLANIHIQQRNYPALLKDLDEYLRLAPNGPDADRARKMQERLREILNSAKDKADSDADDGEQPQADNKGQRSAPGKEPAQPDEPDTSGLPSLPPPDAGTP